MNKLNQNNQVINRKCRLCFYLSISLVIGLSLIKMILANSHSTRGNSLQNIENQVFQIQAENQKLKTKIASLTGGLNQISQQAKEKGFIETPQIKTFVKAPPLAQKLP